MRLALSAEKAERQDGRNKHTQHQTLISTGDPGFLENLSGRGRGGGGGTGAGGGVRGAEPLLCVCRRKGQSWSKLQRNLGVNRKSSRNRFTAGMRKMGAREGRARQHLSKARQLGPGTQQSGSHLAHVPRKARPAAQSRTNGPSPRLEVSRGRPIEPAQSWRLVRLLESAHLRACLLLRY